MPSLAPSRTTLPRRARVLRCALHAAGMTLTLAISSKTMVIGSFAAVEGQTTRWLIEGLAIMFAPVVANILSVGVTVGLMRAGRARAALTAAAFPLIWPPLLIPVLPWVL